MSSERIEKQQHVEIFFSFLLLVTHSRKQMPSTSQLDNRNSRQNVAHLRLTSRGHKQLSKPIVSFNYNMTLMH